MRVEVKMKEAIMLRELRRLSQGVKWSPPERLHLSVDGVVTLSITGWVNPEGARRCGCEIEVVSPIAKSAPLTGVFVALVPIRRYEPVHQGHLDGDGRVRFTSIPRSTFSVIFK